MDKITYHLNVVTRHDLKPLQSGQSKRSVYTYHLLGSIWSAIGEGESDGDISRSKEELWPVITHEWSIATTYKMHSDRSLSWAEDSFHLHPWSKPKIRKIC